MSNGDTFHIELQLEMLKQKSGEKILGSDKTKQTQPRYGLDAGFKSLGQTGSYIEGAQLANFSLTGSYSQVFLSVLV